MNARGEFSSKLGFILAAAGSAVGLGNIWGFPTEVASNGGAAFVMVYIILAFVLAYPVLMAELIIGRATRANMLDALETVTQSALGRWTGALGLLTVCLILAFYAIIAGWMIAYVFESFAGVLSLQSLSQWLVEPSISRNIGFMLLFVALTASIVIGGVSGGIERWSVRLMPTLFALIILLVVYVSTLPGAGEGWTAYLVPDFTRVLNSELLINAMGQAFFSMSLGVGTMLIYGSYINKKENLPSLGASVALVDIAVAVLAGMLIIPAMYVALHNGVQIFDTAGTLIEGDKLVFTVLPALFDTMGSIGPLIAIIFFALMVIAALTSSISMLEVPVAYVVENKNVSRYRAVALVAGGIATLSAIITLNFDFLFGFVVTLTTKFNQPLLGLLLSIYTGWLWSRHKILNELRSGFEQVEYSVFWKIWPWYLKFVCPMIILMLFYRSIFY